MVYFPRPYTSPYKNLYFQFSLTVYFRRPLSFNAKACSFRKKTVHFQSGPYTLYMTHLFYKFLSYVFKLSMMFSNPVNFETCFQVNSHISKFILAFPSEYWWFQVNNRVSKLIVYQSYGYKFTITFRIPVNIEGFITYKIEYEIVLVLRKVVLELELVL